MDLPLYAGLYVILSGYDLILVFISIHLNWELSFCSEGEPLPNACKN